MHRQDKVSGLDFGSAVRALGRRRVYGAIVGIAKRKPSLGGVD
jgi:hypothetical protein